MLTVRDKRRPRRVILTLAVKNGQWRAFARLPRERDGSTFALVVGEGESSEEALKEVRSGWHELLRIRRRVNDQCRGQSPSSLS